jgi:thiol:disulfide interchange protein DsbD
MKKLSILLLISLMTSFKVQAQIISTVSWNFTTVPGSENDQVKVVLTAKLAPDWHIYSQNTEPGGPLPTQISFEPSEDFMLIGSVSEVGSSERALSSTFHIKTTYYSNSVSFIQVIQLKTETAKVVGRIEYMLCTKDKCTMPTEVGFNVLGKISSE